MAALGGHARRLQAGRTGPHDGDDFEAEDFATTWGRVASRPVEGLWMQSASRPSIDAVEAIGGADAGADVLLAALGDLLHDMRIGDMGARHPHHVELALGDGVAGGGDIVDARGMEYRELRRGAHFAGEIEMRRGRHATDRNDLRQRPVMIDVAA